MTIFPIILFMTAAYAAERTAPPPLPQAALTADEVLSQVVARLPSEPLQISGELRADPRDNKPGRRCQIQLSLDFGGHPPQARYTIMDAFGEDLEQLTIIRPSAGPCSWHYAKGYPLSAAPLPDPRLTLQGTDLTWSDLSLSFLWWRGTRLTGTEKVLDRDCLVIEAPAPAGEQTPYALVRLWIDRQYLMLLRADGCGPDGIPIRRIAVKSIKKMGDDWMVKDLDVTRLPSDLRTSLRINLVDKPDTEGHTR